MNIINGIFKTFLTDKLNYKNRYVLDKKSIITKISSINNNRCYSNRIYHKQIFTIRPIYYSLYYYHSVYSFNSKDDFYYKIKHINL